MDAARRRPLRALVLVLDAVLVVAAMALAAGLHAALRGHVDALRAIPPFEQYALVAVLAVPLWLALTALLGLHRTFEHAWGRAALVIDLLALHGLGLLGLAAMVLVTQATINRSLIALFLACSFLLSYAVRAALGLWLGYQHRVGLGRTRLLLVAEDGAEIQALLRAAAASPRPPEVVGQLGAAATAGVPHLGGLADVARVLHEQAIDRVLFLPPYHRAAEVASALEACATVGVSAELAIELPPPVVAAPRIVDGYGRPFVALDAAPRPAAQLAIKHAFDWVAALLGVVVLAPVLLLVALAILVTMGRPIFFTQARAGLAGRTFKMIKFRTMVPGAEALQAQLRDRNELDGPVFKVTGDPRVTRLGRLLRKTSLDELPQLFNVLLGSMSLVGPRPLPVHEQQGIHGDHRRRLTMKPGITGVWQVSGRSDIDFEEWMRLDRHYVDTWSLGLDLQILLRTIPVVLFGRGAR